VDKLGSPEIPAYLSYLLVLICGMLVARSQVNRLLSAFPQRWGFLTTWALFWAHAALPVFLFWFLDYTDALHDTSLFAALLVAFGYRQIFIGGIESIRLPGQTQRLWKPFEAWINRLVQHITSVSKRYLDRFDERVTSTLASDNNEADLMATAFLHTRQRDQLEKALADLKAEKAPDGLTPEAFDRIQRRKRVGLLLRDLRSSVGEDYGYYLYQRRVIRLDRYLRWFGNVRSRAIAYGVTIIVFLFLVVAFYFAYRSPALRIRYSQWRFVKASNTELDRFRNRDYLISQLQAGHVDPVLTPVLARLRYKDCPNRLADDVLRLVVDTHQPHIDKVVIPLLIEALRTENSDVRLRILRTLVDLSKASYDVSSLKDEMSWVPAKDDSPGVIDAHVRMWQSWWANVQTKLQSPLPSPSPSPSPTPSPSP
jgi:hypothetical protein